MEKYEHIQGAIGFADLIRTTLGPRGMNKMIVDDNNNPILLSNDGASIINTLKGGNPIVDLFKRLAKSQELAIGDGTTTTTLLAGQLLSNALTLLNKGIHPTVIIQGYALARQEAVKFVKSLQEEPEKEKLIRTCFGTKLTKDLVTHLTNLILTSSKDLRLYKIDNSDPFESQIFKGYVLDGFTINDRMAPEVDGKIAVLDFPINFKMDKFSVTSADEMEKVQNLDAKFKFKVVDKLKELGVKWVFYTDTTPEFESYLTDAGITGVVIFQREHVDGVCKATHAKAVSSLEQLDETHLGNAHIRYKKQLIGNQGHVFIDGDVETLVLYGPTAQTLDEMTRSVEDVLGILKRDLHQVVGAGAIEIETALHLRNFATQVGGKTQLAIEKFAESLEALPLILAENCGLDAIEILTTLKTLHAGGEKNMGVDMIEGISDAKERGIVEPALIKINAISSATDVANLILKLDKIFIGELK